MALESISGIAIMLADSVVANPAMTIRQPRIACTCNQRFVLTGILLFYVVFVTGTINAKYRVTGVALRDAYMQSL